MNVYLSEIMLGIWIVITLGIDLWLGWISYKVAYVLSTFTDGSYPVCIGFQANSVHIAYPFHSTIIFQSMISLVLVLIGLIWSNVALLVSERLLVVSGLSRHPNIRSATLLTSMASPIGILVLILVLLNSELSLWTMFTTSLMGIAVAIGILILITVLLIFDLFILQRFLQFLSFRFSNLSVFLFKIGLAIVLVGVLIGNVSLVLEQIHHRQIGDCFTHY
jgi:hypothetical protein